MRHEAFRSSAIPGPSGPDRITNSLDKAGPIAVFGRALDPVIARAIDDLPLDLFPSLRTEGDVAEIDTALRSALADLRRLQSWLEVWLRDDIAFLARLYSELTGASTLALRLEPVTDDACRRFHADNVTYRLITTYRGPGTEWVSPRDAYLVEDGELSDVSARRQLQRGWVGVLRGTKSAGSDAPALLHRSPPVRSREAARLFLAIDDARDWPGGQPKPAPSVRRHEPRHGR
ncbi:DUF1826 domain-containing protein [Amorphus sp. 3PC139-8]|uniref:DUF1826 domain-containing protein n=1 Tax=Amorphus sp. 3PC139-8 TaxID=2735676 RepID=UPI00345D2D76